MEPVSSAIIGALTEAAVSPAIKASYANLKNIIINKLAHNKDIIDAVNKLEEKPSSRARQELLREELIATNVKDDAEICGAAENLLMQLGNSISGQNVTQNVNGHNNVFSGTGNVTINLDKS
jgi:hypothetical protein